MAQFTHLLDGLRAAAESTRLRLIALLAEGEMTVGEIAEPYAMSLAAVSKHLDVLERASLIQRERRGSCRMVRLNPRPLQSAQEWLNFYEQFWTQNLDRLQQLLEQKKEPARPKSTPRSAAPRNPNHRHSKKEK